MSDPINGCTVYELYVYDHLGYKCYRKENTKALTVCVLLEKVAYLVPLTTIAVAAVLQAYLRCCRRLRLHQVVQLCHNTASWQLDSSSELISEQQME